jgi:S1-C subfamily serine protease
VKSGVLLASVRRIPGRKAGLKAGDVITAIDGHSVTSPADLIGPADW